MQEFIIIVGFMVFMAIVLNVVVVYEVKRINLAQGDKQEIVAMIMLPYLCIGLLSMVVAGVFVSEVVMAYATMVELTILILFMTLLSVFDNDIRRMSKIYVIIVAFSVWVFAMLLFFL